MPAPIHSRAQRGRERGRLVAKCLRKQLCLWPDFPCFAGESPTLTDLSRYGMGRDLPRSTVEGLASSTLPHPCLFPGPLPCSPQVLLYSGQTRVVFRKALCYGDWGHLTSYLTTEPHYSHSGTGTAAPGGREYSGINYLTYPLCTGSSKSKVQHKTANEVERKGARE